MKNSHERARARPKSIRQLRKVDLQVSEKFLLFFFCSLALHRFFRWSAFLCFCFFPQIFFVDSFQFHADEEWTSKKVNRNHFTFNWIQFTSFYLFLVEFNRMEKFSFFSCFTLCCSSKFIPGYLNMLRLFKIKTNVKLIK